MKNIVRKMMGLAALAVLTLGGVTEVKGETYQNVTFNDGVRYSQWTINSRIRDFRGNTKRMGFNTYNSAGELQGSDISSEYWWNNDTGSKTRNFTIDYVAGLVAKAIYDVGDKVGQIMILPYPQINFTEVDSLSETERGDGGFGSTGN